MTLLSRRAVHHLYTKPCPAAATLATAAVLLAALGLASVAVGTQATVTTPLLQSTVEIQPAMPEIARPAATAPATAAADLPKPTLTADELLSKLETADKDLRTITAQIQYVKQFPEEQGGGSHTRRGVLSFANKDPGLTVGKPRRQFAVTFNELILGTTRRVEPRSFVFDGAFLVERDEVNKQFFKKRVVAEGSTADPMRIGEGPLPLPIGQRRADIVGRFEVAAVSPLENVPEGEKFAKLRELLAKAHQLKLSPRAGTPQAKDYREIRLWYRGDDFLPVFAQSITPDGSRHEVFLVNVKRNDTIAPSTFSTIEPDRQDGWTVDVSEFRSQDEPASDVTPALSPKDAPAPMPAQTPANAPATMPEGTPK